MSDSADPVESAALPKPPYWIAGLLVAWLALIVVGAGFATAVLLSSAEDYAESTSFQLVLCMTGGALGASLTALLAAGERIARGWSFGLDALARTERRFNARLAPLLAVQPILGAALGMVLLLALSSGSVMLLRLTEGTTFDPMGLLLFSVVAGLFARTLLARVRDSVEALFGRATGGAEPDPLRAGRRPGLEPREPTVAPEALPTTTRVVEQNPVAVPVPAAATPGPSTAPAAHPAAQPVP